MPQQGITSGGVYGDHSKCLEYPFARCSHHINGTYKTCPEKTYTSPTCFWACDPQSTSKISYDASQAAHKFGTSYKVDANVAAIQADILAHGPVQASMLLTTYYLLLTTYYSLLTTHHSLLITYNLLLTTHYSLLTIHGPVQASMFLVPEFEVYQRGVFTTSNTKYIGAHAVKIVGWGVDPKSTMAYWTIQNSWNAEWGEAGYFRIERGKNILAIEAGVVGGTLDKW